MKKLVLLALLATIILSCDSNSKEKSSTHDFANEVTTDKKFFNDKGVVVTPESYPTNETSRQILKTQTLVGVNNFLHKPQLTPTDNQPVVRMNRDTYYSFAVIDVSKGAKIIMPKIPNGKYMSVQGVTEDHRIQAMRYGSGTFNLSTHIGDHLYLIIRLDATLTEEQVKDIQGKMQIEANSNMAFATAPVNIKSFTEVENILKSKLPAIAKADGINLMRGMFTDPRDKSAKNFSDEKYQVGAALGWGGAQMIDNIYESSGNFSTEKSYQVTFEDPKNIAFWSITAYNEKGFMFNDLANYSSNTAQVNNDGTYTISFGCGNEAKNNLEIDNSSKVFNIVVRHYQPSKRVIKGNYRIVPQIEEVVIK